MISLLFLLACGTPEPGFPVHGVVVEVSAADEVVIQHDDIPGLMEAMTMPFHVQDPALLSGLEPGHEVDARLVIGESGGFLTKVSIVGKAPIPKVEKGEGAEPLRVGQVLPSQMVRFEDGTEGPLLEPGVPTALTFLYTQCPLPEFCPATVAKFQAMAAQEGTFRLVAVTLDPANDTPEVLAEFAQQSGAEAKKWRFAIAPDLDKLALQAGLPVLREEGQIMHGKRVLLLDGSGKLLARHDDLSFDAASAVRTLVAR